MLSSSAPSVVTVIVEEQGPGAGQRAADRAIAGADNDADAAVRTIVRRLLGGRMRVRESLRLSGKRIDPADGDVVQRLQLVFDGALIPGQACRHMRELRADDTGDCSK